MKKIVGDILKNKNINDNLKAYYKKFMEINNQYASIRLAMNYYTYYSVVSEDDGILESEQMSQIAIINEAIENVFYRKQATDIEKLEALREEIITKVQDLICYIDRLNIYEHALNRVEYRFKDEDYPAGYSDEKLTRKLMQFILEDEDRMAINRKISQVLGQLPVRLTKNKFFEMLSNGIDVYKDGTKESINDFVYMLKTSAMLEKSETMTDNYPFLEEAIDKLKQVSYKNMTQDIYEETKDELTRASEYVEDCMNAYMMLQEVLNDLLVMLYTWDYCMDDGVSIACREIITDTNLLFVGKFSPKSIEEIEDMFVMLEGSQEEIYPKLTSYDITDQIKSSYSNDIAELGLTNQYDIVFKLPKLNADSLFADVNKVSDESLAEDEYVETIKEELFKSYSEVFSENEVLVRRAIMAATIAELPVFFNNISELQDFIYDTLSVCSDKAEKLACIEILNGIMEE